MKIMPARFFTDDEISVELKSGDIFYYCSSFSVSRYKFAGQKDPNTIFCFDSNNKLIVLIDTDLIFHNKEEAEKSYAIREFQL